MCVHLCLYSVFVFICVCIVCVCVCGGGDYVSAYLCL